MHRLKEHDALIESYVHLDKLPRAKEALGSLQKIASLVKPIMRKRGWRIGALAEFFPTEQNLLGLNIDRGRKICIRLRYAGDQTQFMPMENCVDTLLHELCHIEIGPHDTAFHALWNSLRDDYTDLKIKGYTGEGFQSKGRRLGGNKIPLLEARRQSRLVAERNKNQQKPMNGTKLGGKPVQRRSNIRSVIADAAQRRATITKGCASGTKDSVRIAEEATRNGFRTRAEEDQANDRAIAEALWELAQEEDRYFDQGPSQLGGLTWNPEEGLGLHPAERPFDDIVREQVPDRRDTQSDPNHFRSNDAKGVMNSGFTFPPPPPPQPPPIPDDDDLEPSSSKRDTLPSYADSNIGRKLSLLITDQKRQIRAPPRTMHPSESTIDLTNDTPSGFAQQTQPESTRSASDSAAVPTPATPKALLQKPWTCPACTLSNPSSYLCCGACDLERPCLDNMVDFASFSEELDGMQQAATQAISPAVKEMGDGLPLPVDIERNGTNSSSGGSSGGSTRSSASTSKSATSSGQKTNGGPPSVVQSSRPSSIVQSRPQSMVSSATTPSLPSASSQVQVHMHGQPQQVYEKRAEGRPGWQCRKCGTWMDHVWWTCSACGVMKSSS